MSYLEKIDGISNDYKISIIRLNQHIAFNLM